MAEKRCNLTDLNFELSYLSSTQDIREILLLGLQRIKKTQYAFQCAITKYQVYYFFFKATFEDILR